jgi:hypothetical protein
VKWVEGLLRKHAALPTSKLILVSDSGFTQAARIKADVANAVPLAPEDLDAADPAFVVVNALSSLWPKQLSVSPEAATIVVRKPDGSCGRIRDVPPDATLYLEDGRMFLPLAAFFNATYTANIEKVHEMIGLAQMTEDLDRFFVFGIGPVIVKEDGEQRHVYLRPGSAAARHTNASKSACEQGFMPMGRVGVVCLQSEAGRGGRGDG